MSSSRPWTLDEARRIPGLHPLLDGPGVGCELILEPGADAERAASQARQAVAQLWPRLGLGEREPNLRAHAGGLSLTVRAPADRLYAAVDALEAALGPEPADPKALEQALTQEADPRLLALLSSDLPIFADDEGFTAGLGRHSRTWPPDALPDLSEIQGARRIPCALVTGTNGKTTTTRLVAEMVRQAGLVPGHTSSDGVVIDGETLERGDWTGPGATRAVLRDPRVDVGVLETARGGLMRRGLALGGVEVAAVTNIAEDHFGEWGLFDLDQMAWAKLGVAAGVRPGGALVVHGRDEALARALSELNRPDLRIRRFADGPRAPDLDAWTQDGALWVRGPRGPERLVEEVEVPITLGGAVRFMVENALCASLVALELGLGLDAVRAALRSFQPAPDSSRGRINRFILPNGGRVVLDFAHNAAGVLGLRGLAEAARPGRVSVLLGLAGDRAGRMADLYADAIASLQPDLVILKELPDHRRGQPEGEMRALARARLLSQGLPEDAILDVPHEVEAAARALDATGPQDLALLLVHEMLDGVLQLLAERGARPTD